jgi:hypothetical protein
MSAANPPRYITRTTQSKLPKADSYIKRVKHKDLHGIQGAYQYPLLNVKSVLPLSNF